MKDEVNKFNTLDLNVGYIFLGFTFSSTLGPRWQHCHHVQPFHANNNNNIKLRSRSAKLCVSVRYVHSCLQHRGPVHGWAIGN